MFIVYFDKKLNFLFYNMLKRLKIGKKNISIKIYFYLVLYVIRVRQLEESHTRSHLMFQNFLNLPQNFFYLKHSTILSSLNSPHISKFYMFLLTIFIFVKTNM